MRQSVPLKRSPRVLSIPRPPVCGLKKRSDKGRPRVFAHPQRSSIRPRQQAVDFDRVARPAALAGSTEHFHVYYSKVLGQPGFEIAQATLKKCEHDHKTLLDLFGLNRSLIFNIIVAPLSRGLDGSGGAYHHTCRSTDLYCDVQISHTLNPDVTNALVVAEEVEVFEAFQNEGWRCGGSNGEGLSRVLASELYPDVLERLGYATASNWLNSRRPNLVGRTLNTDTSPVGNGCAVLFLNYLHVQLGFSWREICQAGAPTLAGTYFKLTNKRRPFAEFAELMETKFPSSETVELDTDNPFPIGDSTAGSETSRKHSKPNSKRKRADNGDT